MASVFLSYDREDLAKARVIAGALEKAGHSVWWDRNIKSGAQYSKEIEQALKRADAVVVLWSERSVESAWVRDEAADGRDSGRLVPVLIGNASPPLGFRQYQTSDLSKWKGRSSAPQFQEMLGAIEALGGAQAADSGVAAVPARKMGRQRLALAAAVGALLILAAALLLWRPWGSGRSTPVVAVTAASQTAAASALARDLLAKLGNLHATQTDSLKLVQGGEDGQQADFVFEVDGADRGSQTTANLVLLGGKDRSLLWSKDFDQPIARQADLKQQLAYTAAKVLRCADEAFSGKGAPLPRELLKPYLNGCSAYSESAGSDTGSLLPIFREVVENAPNFEDGWAKLLLVESDLAGSFDRPDVAEAARRRLARHMEQARRLNPDMAALLLVEVQFLPPNAFGKRLAMLERAVERNPESAEALSAYSVGLRSIGRTNDGIDQAKRAVDIDPLSPNMRDSLITSLSYAGRSEQAEEELRKAEQLWPGASSVTSASYRHHLRNGDPNVAIRIHRSGAFGGPHRDAFLRARLNPTPENIEEALSRPRAWFRRYPEAIGELAQVYGAFDMEEELIPHLLNWSHPQLVGQISEILFRPALGGLHHDPRMMAIAKRLGLLDYWRSSGKWPDFCIDPYLPYDCRAEAAKLAR